MVFKESETVELKRQVTEDIKYAVIAFATARLLFQRQTPLSAR